MLKKTVFYRMVCFIALLTLSLSVASPVSPTQAKQIETAGPDLAAPAALGSLSTATTSAPAKFKPLTGDSPIAPPSINAQPVLERARHMGSGPEQRIQNARTPATNKHGGKQAVSSVPVKKQTALTQTKPVDKRLPAALDSLAGLPTALNSGKANLPAFNALTSLQSPATDGCYNWLYNSNFEIDKGDGWLVYTPNVYIDNIAYGSPTSSLRMVEENNTIDPYYGSDGDIDTFGQVFYFPDTSDGIDLNSLDIWFQTADYSGPGDSLYVLFYEADQYGNVDWEYGYLGGKYVALDNTGQWAPHYFTVDFTDSDPYAPVIQDMKGKNIAIVLTAYGDNVLTPKYDISVDDVYMSLCTSMTVPTGEIDGQVTQDNGLAGEWGLSDAAILLTYEDPTTDGPQVIDFTFPDVDGYYSFYSLFPLPTDQSGTYQVWFMNIFEDDTRVMLWAGPSTKTFPDGDIQTADPFDISNLELNSPENEAQVPISSGLNYQWSDRGVTGDEYYLCMYDELSVLDYNTVCSSYPIAETQVTWTEADFTSNVPGFLVYGHRYLWYVLPVDPVNGGVGYSYYANGLTILDEAPPVIVPPATSGTTPDDTRTREWLLMIYLAGDNNLGDPAQILSDSSFIKHYDNLKLIARSYSNIHVVVLSDFYDSSGTQICYLSVSPAECQQLGEQDTANPQTLRDFVKNALAKFPHKRAALVISDHGHGISGLAVDETTHRRPGVTTLDGYMMNPTELRTALTDAGLKTSKLDLLYFNTCLMGNLETAFNVQDFAQYMVASSNEMWMLDIYTAMLPLFNNTALADIDLAKALAKAYGDKISPLGYPFTIAAYNLSYADDLRLALSNLAAKLSTLYDDSSQIALKSAMKSIRIDAQLYDSSGDMRIDEEDAFTDLKHLVMMMSDPDRMPNVEVVNRATTVKNLLPSLIIYNQRQSGTTGDGITHNLLNANGLSVYFPDRNEGTQLTLTREIGDKLEYYATGNEWITYTDKYVKYILGNPNTNPGGSTTSGPFHISSGVLPPSSSFAAGEFTDFIYLPSVRR